VVATATMLQAASPGRSWATASARTYAYNADGQLLHLVNYLPDDTPDGSILSRFDYTYDSRGSRTSMTTLDGRWTYAHDDIGQLTHAIFTSTNSALVPNQDLAYAYDAAGNAFVLWRMASR